MSDQIPNERKSSTIRQSSRYIKTDDTGASINTINTILCGLSETMRKTNNPKAKLNPPLPPLRGVEKVNINKPKIIKNKSKVVVSKKRNFQKVASKISTSVLINKKNKTIKKPLRKSSVKELREIFHNRAVKPSNSTSNSEGSKCKFQNKQDKLAVPPLNMNRFDEGEHARNYEMPTISSRMKQVAKYYMNRHHLKNLPFCQTMSTGPSHNIAINIQQVMNMVKNKQSVTQKLSPTLIYNIGLAVKTCGEHLVSTVMSNIATNTSQCPLARSKINYQKYQEIAKTIPEEELLKSGDKHDSPDTQSFYITGPSGDIKVKKRKTPNWAVDANNDKNCTCVPKKGADFQQVYNKYGATSDINTKPQQVRRISTQNQIKPKNRTVSETQKENLKERLHKLHDEFESMNKRYGELTKTSMKDLNEETKKEMTDLDKKLCQKEKEIERVMSLYEETLTLKQNLKKSGSINETNSKNENALSGLKSASVILDKLLKQVQQYQNQKS